MPLLLGDVTLTEGNLFNVYFSEFVLFIHSRGRVNVPSLMGGGKGGEKGGLGQQFET